MPPRKRTKKIRNPKIIKRIASPIIEVINPIRPPRKPMSPIVFITPPQIFISFYKL